MALDRTRGVEVNELEGAWSPAIADLEVRRDATRAIATVSSALNGHPMATYRLSDPDWVRAIRFGVRRDGRSLIVMPSEVFAHLSDRDLAAIIAYYRQLPPVDRELPVTRFGPLGRVLLASGRLNLLVAPKTPRVTPADIAPAASPEYGRYLADIAGCHGCHGYGLSGGRVAGPPGLPPAANLTPAGAIAGWSEADFAHAMRIGARPDGTVMDRFMPWQIYTGMSDEELRALWLYLKTVPAKPFGNK